MIGSTDAGLANFGELTAYPSPVNTSADTSTYGASFVLFDNLWGTNYVEWWPFQVPNLTLTRPNLTLALTIHPFKYRSILPSIHPFKYSGVVAVPGATPGAVRRELAVLPEQLEQCKCCTQAMGRLHCNLITRDVGGELACGCRIW